MLGEKTHTRKWVNYEISNAHTQGKPIVGIFKRGCNNSVELPSTFKKYGGPTIGWNSLDKLGDIMSGDTAPIENPDGSERDPIHDIVRISCG